MLCHHYVSDTSGVKNWVYQDNYQMLFTYETFEMSENQSFQKKAATLLFGYTNHNLSIDYQSQAKD